MIESILGTSIALQIAAIAIALRLGWLTAGHWGFGFVALAIGALLARQLFTVWRMVSDNDLQVLDTRTEWATLAVSALLVTGLLLLLPAFAGRTRTETTREAADPGLRLQLEETRRRQAETELRERAEELARSNRELEQFAYVASHDLQEPLRMIASFTQLLAQRNAGQRDAASEEYMGYVTEGVTRMQALIDGLLRLSRVGRGSEFAPVDCNVVLEDCLPGLRLALEEADATVTRDELPTIRADALQIAILFQNLVGNAIKFRSRARPPHVHVSVQREDSACLFRVRDNGIGIEQQHATRVFVIFQRLHGRDEYPGTGIGLALCQKIVERHGGTIWFESVPGEGTTFLFRIPDERA